MKSLIITSTILLKCLCINAQSRPLADFYKHTYNLLLNDTIISISFVKAYNIKDTSACYFMKNKLWYNCADTIEYGRFQIDKNSLARKIRIWHLKNGNVYNYKRGKYMIIEDHPYDKS